jgi:hypothetical protein
MKLQEQRCFMTAPFCVVGGIFPIVTLMWLDSVFFGVLFVVNCPVLLYQFYINMNIVIGSPCAGSFFYCVQTNLICQINIQLNNCTYLSLFSKKEFNGSPSHKSERFHNNCMMNWWCKYGYEKLRVSCLNKLFSLLCSLEECGRYLETIKVYENKPADSIREHMDNDYLSRVYILAGNPLRNKII